MKYIQKSLLLLYILTLASVSSTSHARGGMKIFDGSPTAPQCRNCHYNLKRFPTLGLNLGVENPDRHHLLIGTVIPPLNRSKAPDAIGAQDVGQTYNCFSCHSMLPESGIPLQEEFEIVEPFRNCLLCHPAWIVTGGMGMMGGRRGGGNGSEIGNVHMDRNPLFLQRNCRACHGAGQGIDTDGDGLSDWPNEPSTGGGMGGGGMGGGGMGRR